MTGQKETCEIHGKPSSAANRTLLLMLLASSLLIIWHVWVYGPSGHGGKDLERPFLAALGGELWDLLFSSHGMLQELWTVFPYFIAGVLLAGLIRTYKLAVRLQRYLRNYGFTSVVLASLIGIITPLCACGTLTTAVSLLFAGLPLAPVMALLVTSPLLSPSTYLLTLNDLGPEWTVIRTVAAFAMGIFAGTVTHLLRNRGFDTREIFIEGAIPRGDFHDEAYPDERLRCNCKEKFGNRVASRTGNMFIIFLAKSAEMLWLVGKYVLVGVAIGTVVERYMPYGWIEQLFGRKNPLSVLWITLGSVPLFLHQVSASSILYHVKSSLQGTLDGGAALAFMIGGPVTAVPAMVLFWTIFKKKVFALYLFVCIGGTILIAYAFQALVFVPSVDMGNPLLKGVRFLSGGPAAVITKQDQNVRIVMDPDGKNIIATFLDETAARGAVAFDAGPSRLFSETAIRYDNAVYAGNVAAWLEENNPDVPKSRILFYRMGSRAGATIPESVLNALRAKGFTVLAADRQQTPHLSDGLLADFSQVWILFEDGSANSSMSPTELDVVARFINQGRGMLLSVNPGQTGSRGYTAVNMVASRYGVQFAGINMHEEKLRAGKAPAFLLRASAALGRFLKFTRKA
jgi:uncharacterized membrane protein YraQ (UPF0718 family)